METDLVKGLVEETTGRLEVSVEMMVADGQNGVKIFMDLCEWVLGGRLSWLSTITARI